MLAGISPQGGTCWPPGRCLASGISSLFPLLSNFKCRTFFRANSTEVKIQLSPVHVDHSEGFGASVHTSAPSQVQGCLELDPSLLMEVTGIHPSASLCLEDGSETSQHRGFLPFFSLQGENISIFPQIIVNLLQPPAKACRDSSQNQLHKNDTFSTTFSGLSLEPFFPLCVLLIKLACHPLLLKQGGPFSKAAVCISLLLDFTKSCRNTTAPHPLHPLHICTRSTSLPTFPLCCRHHWAPQKWQIAPKNPLGLPGGKGRACKIASPGPPVSSVLFSMGHSITPASAIELMLPIRRSHQHLILMA